AITPLLVGESDDDAFARNVGRGPRITPGTAGRGPRDSRLPAPGRQRTGRALQGTRSRFPPLCGPDIGTDSPGEFRGGSLPPLRLSGPILRVHRPHGAPGPA